MPMKWRPSGCAIGAIAIVLAIVIPTVVLAHRPLPREVSFGWYMTGARYGPAPWSGAATIPLTPATSMSLSVACPPGTELWLDEIHGATATSRPLVTGKSRASVVVRELPR
jgi:hypothetical protein